MSVAVSVVVIAKNFRSSLGEVIGSLDQQSLPTSAFDVVLVDLGSTDGTVERLRQLVTHRPNVKLLELDDAAVGDPSSWLGECAGDFIFRLSPDQRLFPEALERMHALASEHGLDAVSARVCEQGIVVEDLFSADRLEVETSDLAKALAGPAVLLGRALVQAVTDSDNILANPPRVGVLASYPALAERHDAGLDKGPPGLSLRQDQPGAEWEAELLRLRLTGAVSATTNETDLTSARPTAFLRHVNTGLSFAVGSPGSMSRHEAAAGGEQHSEWGWDLAVELDVNKAALGAPLQHGLWEIDVQLFGVAGQQPPPLTVAWTACPPAVIGRTLVVPSPALSPTLQVDIGPTVWPFVAGVDPDLGTVTETAAGSMMTLPLPHVHVSSSEKIDGQIALDQLRLRAQIVTDMDSARLEGLVSGLFGIPALSTQFGDTGMKPSGLGVEVSGLGAMKVVRAKPAPAKKAAPPPATAKKATPAKKAAPKKAPAKKAPVKKVSSSQHAAPQKEVPTPRKPAPKAPTPAPSLAPAQRVRRAVPAFLEPVVERVAKNSLARKIYRKALRS